MASDQDKALRECAAALSATLLSCGQVWAAGATPIPSNALPSTPTTQYGAAIDYRTSGATATITQTAPTNIVNWKSFDIGSKAKVEIVQPSSSAVLLNKVEGGLSRTTIDGMLNANGRVYIYNPNGVVFGKNATINVDTLMASSLKFDESRVVSGLLQPGSTPVLGADPAFGARPGDVRVDKGARLTAANGGSILLAAPTVVNNGQLNAPDGQVILAAGNKVYLAAPDVSQTGTRLRGLLVEVSNTDQPNGTGGGSSQAENGATGKISVGRGNATMIGYAVNQDGLISASTSVELNGSIYLHARDQAISPNVGTWQASRTGKLVLGPNSITEVKPLLEDKATISAATTFNRSEVALDGADIQLQQNARISVPGGNVTISATRLQNNDGAQNILNPATDNIRVDFAPGSVVDVSGSTGTVLPMESNVVSLDLRGAELADNVVLRDSPLYGSKVQIDARKGTSIANISGWLDLMQYNLGQLNAGGGTVKVNADGAIIQRAGSKINVDGGWVDYKSGYVNTTQLALPSGAQVDIGAAAANTLYTAASTLPITDKSNSANFEAGYRQGSSAGTVQLSAPIVAQQGALSGQATVGERQRDVTAVTATHSVNNVPISKITFGYPQGGELLIGNVTGDLMDAAGKAKISKQIDQNSSSNQFVYSGNLNFGAGVSQNDVPPAVDAPFGSSMTSMALDTAALSQAGFSRIAALTSGNIDIAAPVTLPAGGHLWLGAGQSPLSTTPGGNIALGAAVTIPGGSLNATASGALNVADNASVNLAGVWTNDQAQGSQQLGANGYPVTPLATKGGALSLSANRLNIGRDFSADVSAGAWLNAKGKLSEGGAGSMAFLAELNSLAPDASYHAAPGWSLSGYGFSSGGSLKILGYGATGFANGLFGATLDLQSGGFTNYDLGTNSDVNFLGAGLLQPLAQSWQLKPTAAITSSGAMAGVAAPVLHNLSGPGRTRPATNLTLRAYSQDVNLGGNLTVGNGVKIEMDPGASLNLYAGRQLTVLGELNAPAGNITLGLMPGTIPDATRSIWFGPNARVLATGSTARLYTDGSGITSGEVLDGGSIRIGAVPQNGVLGAADGYVVAEQGAWFDVSGAQALGQRFKYNGAVTPVQDVTSSGGSIDIHTKEGLLFQGTLRGYAGGSGANGGTLAVALDKGDYGNDILNIFPGAAGSGNFVPTIRDAKTGDTRNLRAGDAIVTDLTDRKGNDLGWYLSGASAASKKGGGEGWISSGSFAAGGFGRLGFNSQDTLAFGLGNADLTLSAGNALVLNAPTLTGWNNSANNAPADNRDHPPQHTLTLSAPYLQLGSADVNWQLPGAAVSGNAQLVANANTLDLIGNSALRGFGNVQLNAAGDMRLIGFPSADANNVSTGYTQGSLAMSGNLSLKAAQVYPATLSDFTFMVAGAAQADGSIDPVSGTLTFSSNGNAAQPPLSAGGSISAIAQHIVQGGQVVAPFGAITLGNLNRSWTPAGFYGGLLDSSTLGSHDPRLNTITTADVQYLPGSVTSVAGSGVVPFGAVVNGSVPTASTWQYSTLASFGTGAANGGGLPVRSLPKKAIASQAGSVQVNGNALLDASGGGSLLAYEFTPGKGGSKDALAAAGTYAINPSFQGGVAPVDADYGSSGLQPAASIYLSGMAGLPAGNYTLLPAHYALLPGGYSVTRAANTRDMQPASNTVLPDGSMLISGVVAGNRSNGFIVASGATIARKSEFALFDADTYFGQKAAASGTPVAEQPVDGGRVAFEVTGATSSSLSVNGVVDLAAAARQAMSPAMNGAKWTGSIDMAQAAGARAGVAEISAPQIEVVSSLPQKADANGPVKLAAGQLNAWGADSLVLGGLRETGSDGAVHLRVGADSVTLGNDAQHKLSAPEVVIAANSAIRLNGGAVVQDSGAPARAAQDLTLDGGGALLRVSGGTQIDVNRDDGAVATGALSVASGATVGASGAAILDGPKGAALDGQINIAARGALSLGAPGISLGSNRPAALAHGKLWLGTDRLAMLNGLSSLALNSYAGTVGLYDNITLGAAAMRSLAFKGAGLKGYGSDAAISADTIRFDGAASNASLAGLSGPAGTLTVSAGSVAIGENTFVLGGYADAVVNASREVRAVGQSGKLAADGNLTLTAGVIDTDAGAHGGVTAGGMLTLAHATAPQPPATAAGLGGQLDFSAASIVSNAQIAAPAGRVSMSVANGINIAGGKIDAAGRGVKFGGTTVYAPGGTISLAGGNVNVAGAATLDVSATGAAAGTLAISAVNANGNGVATLGGTLKGAAAAGQAQGRFLLDADTGGAQFGALNGKLNAAGFNESRQFRYRNGDVTLGGDDSVVAHQVAIAADNGSIAIGNSVIDASGAKGGSIALYASQAAASGNSGKVGIAGNASLLANGKAGNGGSVTIGTGSADGLAATAVNGGSSIDLAGGSIDVGGAAGAANGAVTLRAPRVCAGSGSDVAVANLNTAIRNSSATKIEAYKVYQARTISETADSASNLDATSGGMMYSDAQAFSGNRSNILRRLGAAGSGATLSPGIDVRSPSDLTVSVNEFASKAADRGWNLDAWRFGGAPIALTLRATNNLSIVGSISDGFVKPANAKLGMPDWSLDSGASASYRFAAGADMAAASPLAVKAGGDVNFAFADRAPAPFKTSVDLLNPRTQDVLATVDVTVPWRSTDGTLTSANVSQAQLNAPVTNNDAPVALVRTGAGSIAVAAGRDVTFGTAKFFVNDATSLHIDARTFFDNGIKGKVSINGAVYNNAAVNGVTYSDPAINGTPRIYDAQNGTSFNVSTYGASLYTAGHADSLSAGFTAPQNQLNTHYGAAAGANAGAAFGSGGGAITINAGRDVAGPHNLSGTWSYQNADYQAADPDYGTPAQPSTTAMLPAVVPQMVNDWLFRQGRSYVDGSGKLQFESVGRVDPKTGKFIPASTLNTAWWTRYDYFGQGVATLGGGDVRVQAGGNVTDLSAGVATNAYAPAAGASMVEQGGGDLQVRAGADIQGGAFYVQKGAALLRADGSVTQGNSAPAADAAALNPVLALGNAAVSVVAGRDLAVESAYNPTLTEQSVNNVATKVAGQPALNPTADGRAGGPYWDVSDTSSAAVGYRNAYAQFSSFSTYGSNSAVSFTALGGDLALSNNAQTLAAAGRRIPDYLATVQSGDVFQNLYALGPSRLSAAALSGNLISSNRYTLMPAPAGQLDLLAEGTLRLGQGAVSSTRPDILMLDNDPAAMSSAAAPRVFAATDLGVLNGTASGIAAHLQSGLHAQDTQPVRLIAQTGDIVGDGGVAATISVGKAAEIVAGRDIVNLGFSIQQNNASDVTTVSAGRDFVETTVTPVPSKGYDDGFMLKNIVTGPGRVDVTAGRNVDFGNRGGLVTRGNLDNPYLPEGGAGVDMLAGAVNYPSFTGFAGDYQNFFAGLVKTGKQDNLQDFDALIASLFPLAVAGKEGNISVFGSQIKTEQGGVVNLFAPAGSVYAGLTTGISGKSPSTQGIFTIRGGAIDALVRNDFLVNQGRVFTLGGGDITLVSQYKDIDAGKGSKTAVSAPPPLITVDPNGNVKVDVSGSIAGSGIATLKTHPDQPASNVYAIAPRGVFNAGDAGVRSSGSVDIAAHVVLNANNISAAGSISGAPVAVAAPALGSIAPPAATSQNSNDVAKSMSEANAANGGVLEVQVVGYGGEASSSDPAAEPAGDAKKCKGESCADKKRKEKS